MIASRGRRSSPTCADRVDSLGIPRGRAVKGIDLRTHGSGNLGATNVCACLGAPAAIIVYALDAAKGALPACCFPMIFGVPAAWRVGDRVRHRGDPRVT